MKVEDIDWNDIQKYNSIINLPEEIWVDVEEGLVPNKISNYGRMLSLRNLDKPMIRRISDNGTGYKKWALTGARCHITGKRLTHNYYVHRLVAKYFLPNPKNLPQVNHMPEGLGKHDNRSSVLEWCTERYNILDAHKNGQMDNRTKVDASVNWKSEEVIEAMYRQYKMTGKVGETARMFDVPRTTLSSIVNKRSRVYITDRVDLEFVRE